MTPTEGGMLRVYIASQYSIGDIGRNVKRSMDAANELMDLGFAPFCPLLSHFLHIHHPRSYESWVEQDNAWVTVCDAVLRLSGESKGADAEVELARAHGIPVFTCTTALYLWAEGIRREEIEGGSQ